MHLRFFAMKKNLLLPLLCLLLASSCEMGAIEADLGDNPANVTEAAVPGTIRKGEALEFWVKFTKPSPCHQIKEVKVSATGLTVNYDVILRNDASPCPTIYTLQDSVKAVFTPQQTGDHTLNFLLNNRLYLVKKVSVNP